MSTLLYCVLAAPPTGSASETGVGGRPVSFVRGGDLAAAVSPVEAVELVPDLKRVIEYERVVEAIFTQRAVVPMRYGSIFAGEREAAHYLEQHAGRLAALLRELHGRAEMSIRVMVPDEEPPARPAHPPPAPRVAGDRAEGAGSDRSTLTGAGRMYLEALRAQFAVADPLRAAREEAVERYGRAFADLVVRRRSEVPSSDDIDVGVARLLAAADEQGRSRLLASIYFLVERERVTAFRERFQQLRPDPRMRIFISGPWPPYNFVTSAPEDRG